MQTTSHERWSRGRAPRRLEWLFVFASMIAGSALEAGSARAELTTVYAFGAPDGYALSALCEGPGGRFYATAEKGGKYGMGVVLRFSRFGDLTVLHSFAGGDGSAPVASLTYGKDGNFYGTTTGGGAFGHGTAFRMTQSGVVTTLHSFTLAEGGGPRAALLLASDGNFYGSTVRVAVFDDALGYSPYRSYGGLFRLTPNGNLTILHSFAGADGSGSVFALLQARDGHLYGSTPAVDIPESWFHPGFSNFGTLFRLTLAGEFTSIFDFSQSDSDAPLNLVELDDGYLYGSSGGVSVWMAEPSPPMFFRISLAGKFEPLRTQGGSPPWILSAAPDGGLYGAAGSVVRISRRGRVTPWLTPEPGGTPPGRFIRSATGALYGTSTDAFFRIVGREPLVLARVSYPLGFDPGGALILARDGNFYGTTRRGGEHGFGTVYCLSPAGDVTRVCSLTRAGLAAELLEARDGALYYTAIGSGTVGRTTKRGTLSTLYSLGTNFSDLSSPLVQGPDGALYGLARQVTPDAYTQIAFRVTTRGAATVPYALEDFQASWGMEDAPLALGDGNWLYRTSANATDADAHAVRVSADGIVNGLFTFPSPGGVGVALVQGLDGNLYGTTTAGVPPNGGAIFRVTPSGVRSNVYEFDRSQGYYPSQELTVAPDGTLFGVTIFGPGDAPTIYRLTPDGTYTELHSFQGSVSLAAPSALTLDERGRLFATLSSGGPEGVGSIVRIDPP